jgi:hypothetical protein
MSVASGFESPWGRHIKSGVWQKAYSERSEPGDAMVTIRSSLRSRNSAEIDGWFMTPAYRWSDARVPGGMGRRDVSSNGYFALEHSGARASFLFRAGFASAPGIGEPRRTNRTIRILGARRKLSAAGKSRSASRLLPKILLG